MKNHQKRNNVRTQTKPSFSLILILGLLLAWAFPLSTPLSAIAADGKSPLESTEQNEPQAAKNPARNPTRNPATNPTRNPSTYDAIFYVNELTGSDLNDGLTEETAFKTLTRTVAAVHSDPTEPGDYLIVVLSNLNSTSCARYYNNSVTIMSKPGAERFTVTRAPGFSIQAEFVGGVSRYYNPAMLEIGGFINPDDPQIALRLENIIFDDAFLYEGSLFNFRAGTDTSAYVQDAIVASYSPNASIILGEGAELLNFGGMTAARAADGATLIMENGSLITENSTTATRAVNPSVSTDYRAVGEAAVSISSNAHFYMYEGARITNIANAHGVKLSGAYKCFIDGEITGLIGARGWDATDHSSSPTHEGRGFKNAILFAGGITLDPWTGAPGAAIIGPNANIHHNQVKCGSVAINRSLGVSVKIYGKVNNNAALAGSRWLGSIPLAAGTNGGGLYIVGGGTIYLEDGSELMNNSVVSSATGGAANIQQWNSKLVMNGGTVSGNTASGSSTATGAGIVINRNNASFVMNGGSINNGGYAVYLMTESPQTDGTLVLNAGSLSGVAVQNTNVYGNVTQRHLYIDYDNVTIGNAFASVAGRQLRLLHPGDLYVGNPNTAIYTPMKDALPTGWTMPSTNGNVIAFWMKKTGLAEFSVPAPTTGSAPTNYNRDLKYFAAVLETNAAGAMEGAIDPLVKIYPTKVEGGQIIVSVPLEAYENGAIVVIVQPSANNGELIFEAPAVLEYDLSAYYTIPYTAKYDIELIYGQLISDGHTTLNTSAQLVIYPAPNTIPDPLSVVLTSEIFEILGTPVWNSVTGEFIIDLQLASGWDADISVDKNSVFEFDCTLADADFVHEGVLELTGKLTIVGGVVGPANHFLIFGNTAATLMLKPECEVTFDGNGGEVLPENERRYVLLGDALASKMPTDIPTRTGYTFVGWNTLADGGGVAFDENTPVLHEALTVYAQWEADSYVVSYEANGGGGAMANQTAYYNQNLTLADNVFVWPGYVFTGWNTLADGSGVAYEAGYSFSPWNLTQDLTLYAQWEADSYMVSYEANGGGGSMANQTAYYNQNFTLADNAFVWPGYVFTGWNTLADGGGVAYEAGYSFSPWNLTQDLTLYAQWEARSYVVSYEANGGGGSMANQTAFYNQNLTLADNAFERPGYVFTGWNTLADGSGVTYEAGYSFSPWNLTQDLTLYAQWEARYSVSFLPGEHGDFAPVTYLDIAPGTPTPAAPGTPGKTGWVFAGWDSEPNTTVNADAVYTALWTQLSYTVDFVDWDGGLLDSQIVLHGEDATAPANPSREGYSFTGWDCAFVNITAPLTVTALYSLIEEPPLPPVPPVEPPVEPPLPPVEPPLPPVEPPLPPVEPPTPPVEPPVEPPVPPVEPPTPPVEPPVEPPLPPVEPPVEPPVSPSRNSWSLFDLVATVLIILLNVVTALRFSLARRRQNQDTEWDDCQNDYQKPCQTHLTILAFSIMATIIALAVFFTTQNMRYPVTLFDIWSILFAVTLLIAILASVFVVSRHAEYAAESWQDDGEIEN